MTTAVTAIYENGVFKPESPVDLKEKTKVHLVIEAASDQSDDDPTGWKTAMSLKGCMKESLGIHEALAVDEDFTHDCAARPGPPSRRS